jgi:methylated-DNA-[protein]-cysteine S-methyltransferase
MTTVDDRLHRMDDWRTLEVMIYTEIESPVARLAVAADEQGLRTIRFLGRGREKTDREWRRDDRARALRPAVRELRAYFAGELRQFSLELAPEGTPFQLDVWRALAAIPYGATTSYADVAQRVGRSKAVRAVGAANGANPLPIVLPCHRVIGSNGSLTGYGGGLPIKRALLDLERGVVDGQQRMFLTSLAQRKAGRRSLASSP